MPIISIEANFRLATIAQLFESSRSCHLPAIVEIAASMITGAERRIDVAATNVSNMNTPGFRARILFSNTVDLRSGLPVSQEVPAHPNSTAALTSTGNPLDFAASSRAVLALRSPAGISYSRSAQLQRTADGRLVDPLGRALQTINGDDLVISSGTPSVLPDGTVLVDGQPQGRIGLFDAGGHRADGAIPTPASDATVMQGTVAGSDVELGDEMLQLNKASRMAETGAKLFQVYDDLLTKVSSQLGSIAK